jgi:hypothetical protein
MRVTAPHRPTDTREGDRPIGPQAVQVGRVLGVGRSLAHHGAMVPRPPCRGTAPRPSLVREQVLDAVQLSDTPKRGRRLPDTERDTGLVGRFTGTKQGCQTGRVDKRQAAGFDGDRRRVRREGFADGCREAGGTSLSNSPTTTMVAAPS